MYTCVLIDYTAKWL